MKILILVDKPQSAIDRLAQAVKRNNPHLDIRIHPVHPKRNDADTIYELSNLLEWCDLIDVHYWKSGEIAWQTFPTAFETKPKILFHMNPYDAENEVNKKYNAVVVGNETIHVKVPYSFLIPYGIDLDFFKFKEEMFKEPVINMTIARIESKKGVLQVAQACKDLGYRLHLIGRVSSGPYVQEVLDTGVVQFFENVTEEELREHYYTSMVHVCNSEDNHESGTLPILEAMACGVPVLTRNIGHVPDLYDGKNMVVRSGQKEDIEDLKTNLKDMVENEGWRKNLREAAWDTVKNRSDILMARKVVKLYYNLWLPNDKVVSVIIPTRDKPKVFMESLIGAVSQDYKKMEVIVVDSGDTSVKKLVDKAREIVQVPIRYIHFPHKDNYTLAEARNRGVVEAHGELLVFCDDRICMERNAVSMFVKNMRASSWIWGAKDGVTKGFVENFSCIARKDLIKHGMFNERIQSYGGMTQDIRMRFEGMNGMLFVLVPEVKSVSVGRARGKNSRREDIIKSKLLLAKLYE